MKHDPYVHQYFPACRYHPTLPPIQVNSPEEEDLLCADGLWRDTPAAFCPHADYAQPGDTHCPRCALKLAAPATPATAATEAATPEPKKNRRR